MNNNKILNHLEKNISQELYKNILPFWQEKTLDQEKGGFYGRMANDLSIIKNAPKGLILNSRILWTFSAAYNFSPNTAFLQLAQRAYDYLLEYFFDQQYGGLVWMVNPGGEWVDDKKRTYGQAFCIYGLSEYYKANREQEPLDKAVEIFQAIEEHVYDFQYKGYLETANRDWSIPEDVRLSEKDMNEKKSMNNHLHVMEAYTNLYRIWKNDLLKHRLKELLYIFRDFIIDSRTRHFKLFFDEKWNCKCRNESYGHDIEGSWLLGEAAEVLGDKKVREEINDIALQMAEQSVENHLGEDGALPYECTEKGYVNTDRHFWVSAEALVGYFNAFQMSGKQKFLDATLKVWEYIENNFRDKRYGEWYYLVKKDGTVDPNEYKVSEWKGPYHNSRACMEMLRRIRELKNKLEID